MVNNNSRSVALLYSQKKTKKRNCTKNESCQRNLYLSLYIKGVFFLVSRSLFRYINNQMKRKIEEKINKNMITFLYQENVEKK